MASLKYEISLLDHNTRFVLWQIKMQAILAQMDLEDALLGIDKMPSNLTDEEKKCKDQKDVMKDKTTGALWKRLEQICMSKTLTSKLHMKQRLYTHRLEEGGPVHEHLIVFKEILSNLEAMERKSFTVDEVYESLTLYDKMKHLVLNPSIRERVSLLVGDKIGMLIIIMERHRNGILNKIKREARNQKGKQPENSGEADVVEDYSDGELLVASVNDSKVSEEWILDSGCTFHMSPNRDWFTTYEIVSECVVLMGNNASCKIAGVGTIKVKMFDRVVRTLSDVRHVPELKRNLILLSTLDSKGYRYTAESGVLKISKVSFVVMKRQRKTAKLYILQGSTVTGDAAAASSSLSDDDITKLWHMRLRHMSENGMVELSKRGLLDGQGICKLNFYEHYNGLEFCSDEFNRLCKLERIVRHLTIRHTLQQNGVAERMNRTIMEKVQCMLSNANLPKSFWAEAASTACFLINRSPSVAIEKKTPQEVWSGNPANYSDLKIFGCPAKVVISRDVVFDETAMLPNLSLKDSSNKENQQVEYHINTESTLQVSTKIDNRVASSPQYFIAKNKTRREIKPPKKYAEADLVAYALNVAEDVDANQEPSNYSEAISCEDSEKWMFAMQEEMESLYKNKTWDLVKLPKGKKTVRCKWVFKRKKGLQELKNPDIKQGLLERVTVKFQEWTSQLCSPQL
ncbi:hypothetical protein CXB51_003754 [Gossypium anomalum]|uniref:Integrase catalytic domain-containing protein n=1 Tax=Gossypium anomalum TaxID=47600 RepID=A0A8J6D7K2_9ROSI|nr:hypothetical protein CXB51_003754 [Gossypium anomalum]